VKYRRGTSHRSCVRDRPANGFIIDIVTMIVVGLFVSIKLLVARFRKTAGRPRVLPKASWSRIGLIGVG
jgi:hypothetical protein